MESSKGSHLPKSLEQSKRLFHGARFDVNAIEMTAKNGRTYQKEAVVHPGAVVILPLVDKDTVVLIQNYRFAAGEYLWELPAGTLEPDEEPQETAFRELIEETGYEAAKIEFLTQFYTTPGICTEVMHAYAAQNLTFVGQNLNETEDITTFTFEWKTILKMIHKGTIKDGKTITAFLFYHQFHK